MEKEITPYDTGKVKIGLLYKVQPVNEAPMDGDADAEYLQAALLKKQENNLAAAVKRLLRKIVAK